MASYDCGTIYARKGDYDRAIDYLSDEAIRLDPNNKLSYNNRAAHHGRAKVTMPKPSPISMSTSAPTPRTPPI